MVIRILLLSLLALLIGSVWLGYERGPFRDLRFLFPAAVREAPVSLMEIPALHQYRHGAHAYVGEVYVPSTCHRVDAESVVRESYPEQVSVNLSIVPDSRQEACEEKAVPKRFKVAF
ncbi:MAG TPA: hypothetical protein VD967_01930, partial [Candidatus Paceibacterota bacterium]|nr:hypothetical protein [Candidatus Paceibacterota bacterium]